MDREYYIKKLQELDKLNDVEKAHVEADNILCEILINLGYQDIVKEWELIYKWYS